VWHIRIQNTVEEVICGVIPLIAHVGTSVSCAKGHAIGGSSDFGGFGRGRSRGYSSGGVNVKDNLVLGEVAERFDVRPKTHNFEISFDFVDTIL
jgi:hypothetical protein